MTLYNTIPVTQSQPRLTDMKFYVSLNLIYIRIILPNHVAHRLLSRPIFFVRMVKFSVWFRL